MITKILVKKLSEDATLPKFNHNTDAGLDLYSAVNIVVKPKLRELVKTNIAVKAIVKLNFLENFINWLCDNKWKTYFKIEDTSGNAYKKGTRTLAGVIDSDYRGDIGVIIYNTSEEPIEIKKGDKIAQMILHRVPYIESILEVNELDETDRGAKGYGSSGGIK